MIDVLKYMDQLDEEDRVDRAKDEFQNSVLYKQRCLDKAKCDARGVCLNRLLRKVYKDAVPLGDEYKTAYNADMDRDFANYMQAKCPKGIEFYIREQQRKNPEAAPACKKLLEKVNALVESYYREETVNPDKINTDELVFDADDPENMKAINGIADELDYPALSDAIAQNVLDTARNEIARADIEKKKNQLIEDQLANDMSILSEESAIMEFNRRTGRDKVYKPSLLEGIMIGQTAKYESAGEPSLYTYRALEPFGKSYTEKEATSPASVQELVFIEGVKELTKINTLNALRLEKYDRRAIDALAMEYATGK